MFLDQPAKDSGTTKSIQRHRQSKKTVVSTPGEIDDSDEGSYFYMYEQFDPTKKVSGEPRNFYFNFYFNFFLFLDSVFPHSSSIIYSN